MDRSYNNNPAGYQNSQRRERCLTSWGERDNRDGYLDPRNLQVVETLYSEESFSGIHFEDYDKIPVDCTEEFPEMESFQDIDAHSALLENLERMGYKRPTPVQK